jgi:proline iminopeptidase
VTAETYDIISNDNLIIKESFIEVEGAKLFSRTIGKGKPLIVIHGGPGLSQDYLQPQLYKLAEDNLVIFYDQRACGRSTGEVSLETINMKTFVEDIEAIRKAFHFDTISVLGHSWGGLLAMNYAIEHPKRIDKLILCNSLPSTLNGTYLFVQECLKRFAPHQAEITKLTTSQGYLEGNPDVMQRYYQLIFSTYMYHPEKVCLLNLRMSTNAFLNDRKINAIFTNTVFKEPYNLDDSLKTLDVPTLIIHGDYDPIPLSTVQSIHEAIKNSKFVLIKNCGHFPYVEAPNDFFNAIHEFVNTTR